MVLLHARAHILAALLMCAVPASLAAREALDRNDKQDAKRPTFSVRASPMMSFSPARIVLAAELKGGPNDYEEFYCPTVEWDWGDGTRSESTSDCEPYEAGKSEIKRRFVIEHLYTLAGNYRVQVKLKRKDKALVAANVTLQVRPGFRDPTIGQ